MPDIYFPLSKLHPFLHAYIDQSYLKPLPNVVIHSFVHFSPDYSQDELRMNRFSCGITRMSCKQHPNSCDGTRFSCEQPSKPCDPDRFSCGGTQTRATAPDSHASSPQSRA